MQTKTKKADKPAKADNTQSNATTTESNNPTASSSSSATPSATSSSPSTSTPVSVVSSRHKRMIDMLSSAVDYAKKKQADTFRFEMSRPLVLEGKGKSSGSGVHKRPSTPSDLVLSWTFPAYFDPRFEPPPINSFRIDSQFKFDLFDKARVGKGLTSNESVRVPLDDPALKLWHKRYQWWISAKASKNQTKVRQRRDYLQKGFPTRLTHKEDELKTFFQSKEFLSWLDTSAAEVRPKQLFNPLLEPDQMFPYADFASTPDKYHPSFEPIAPHLWSEYGVTARDSEQYRDWFHGWLKDNPDIAKQRQVYNKLVSKYVGPIWRRRMQAESDKLISNEVSRRELYTRLDREAVNLIPEEWLEPMFEEEAVDTDSGEIGITPPGLAKDVLNDDGAKRLLRTDLDPDTRDMLKTMSLDELEKVARSVVYEEYGMLSRDLQTEYYDSTRELADKRGLDLELEKAKQKWFELYGPAEMRIRSQAWKRVYKSIDKAVMEARFTTRKAVAAELKGAQIDVNDAYRRQAVTEATLEQQKLIGMWDDIYLAVQTQPKPTTGMDQADDEMEQQYDAIMAAHEQAWNHPDGLSAGLDQAKSLIDELNEKLISDAVNPKPVESHPIPYAIDEQQQFIDEKFKESAAKSVHVQVIAKIEGVRAAGGSKSAIRDMVDTVSKGVEQIHISQQRIVADAQKASEAATAAAAAPVDAPAAKAEQASEGESKGEVESATEAKKSDEPEVLEFPVTQLTLPEQLELKKMEWNTRRDAFLSMPASEREGLIRADLSVAFPAAMKDPELSSLLVSHESRRRSREWFAGAAENPVALLPLDQLLASMPKTLAKSNISRDLKKDMMERMNDIIARLKQGVEARAQAIAYARVFDKKYDDKIEAATQLSLAKQPLADLTARARLIDRALDEMQMKRLEAKMTPEQKFEQAEYEKERMRFSVLTAEQKQKEADEAWTKKEQFEAQLAKVTEDAAKAGLTAEEAQIADQLKADEQIVADAVADEKESDRMFDDANALKLNSEGEVNVLSDPIDFDAAKALADRVATTKQRWLEFYQWRRTVPYSRFLLMQQRAAGKADDAWMTELNALNTVDADGLGWTEQALNVYKQQQQDTRTLRDIPEVVKLFNQAKQTGEIPEVEDSDWFDDMERKEDDEDEDEPPISKRDEFKQEQEQRLKLFRSIPEQVLDTPVSELFRTTYAELVDHPRVFASRLLQELERVAIDVRENDGWMPLNNNPESAVIPEYTQDDLIPLPPIIQYVPRPLTTQEWSAYDRLREEGVEVPVPVPKETIKKVTQRAKLYNKWEVKLDDETKQPVAVRFTPDYWQYHLKDDWELEPLKDIELKHDGEDADDLAWEDKLMRSRAIDEMFASEQQDPIVERITQELEHKYWQEDMELPDITPDVAEELIPNPDVQPLQGEFNDKGYMEYLLQDESQLYFPNRTDIRVPFVYRGAGSLSQQHALHHFEIRMRSSDEIAQEVSLLRLQLNQTTEEAHNKPNGRVLAILREIEQWKARRVEPSKQAIKDEAQKVKQEKALADVIAAGEKIEKAQPNLVPSSATTTTSTAPIPTSSLKPIPFSPSNPVEMDAETTETLTQLPVDLQVAASNLNSAIASIPREVIIREEDHPLMTVMETEIDPDTMNSLIMEHVDQYEIIGMDKYNRPLTNQQIDHAPIHVLQKALARINYFPNPFGDYKLWNTRSIGTGLNDIGNRELMIDLYMRKYSMEAMANEMKQAVYKDQFGVESYHELEPHVMRWMKEQYEFEESEEKWMEVMSEDELNLYNEYMTDEGMVKWIAEGGLFKYQQQLREEIVNNITQKTTAAQIKQTIDDLPMMVGTGSTLDEYDETIFKQEQDRMKNVFDEMKLLEWNPELFVNFFRFDGSGEFTAEGREYIEKVLDKMTKPEDRVRFLKQMLHWKQIVGGERSCSDDWALDKWIQQQIEEAKVNRKKRKEDSDDVTEEDMAELENYIEEVQAPDGTLVKCRLDSDGEYIPLRNEELVEKTAPRLSLEEEFALAEQKELSDEDEMGEEEDSANDNAEEDDDEEDMKKGETGAVQDLDHPLLAKWNQPSTLRHVKELPHMDPARYNEYQAMLNLKHRLYKVVAKHFPGSGAITIKLNQPQLYYPQRKFIAHYAGSEPNLLARASAGLAGQQLFQVIFLMRKYRNANILAEHIARELSSVKSHSTVLRNVESMAKWMEAIPGLDTGLKIKVSGRINGAAKARHYVIKAGNLPLQTIHANVDYAQTAAHARIGVFGVKVWLFQRKLERREMQSKALLRKLKRKI